MACQYCMTSAVGRCQYCGPQGAATVAHDWDQLQRRYSSARIRTCFAATVAHDWDQLQQQLDALRAEVERLRGQSKAELLNAKQSQDAWSEALKLRDSARARAEAAERERDEAQAQTRHWREAAVKENERAMEYLNAAAEAQAHAADEAAPEVKP